MAFRPRIALTLTLLGAGSVVPLTSCGIPEGLGDVGSSLANPDASLLDSPGRRLAEGKYRDLLVDGSIADGGHVIAVRTDVEPNELSVLPYLEGEGCSVSPTHSFDRLSSRIDIELEGIISVQHAVNEEGRGDVSFVDFDCEPAIDPLQNATLPQLGFPALSPEGLLSLTGDGDLYLVNPQKKELRKIDSGVAQARSAGNHLWYIKEGKLRVLNTALEEVATLGNEVSTFAVTGGDVVAAVFQDQEGLHRYGHDEGATLIAEDGCSPMNWGVETVAYFAPCSERKLQVHTQGVRVGADTQFVTIAGPSGVSTLQSGFSFWGFGTKPSEVTFLLGEPDSSTGQLMLGTLPAVSEGEGELRDLDLQVLAEAPATIRGNNLFSHWDGEIGSLLEVTREDDLAIGAEVIAERVVQLPGNAPYSPRGMFVNFEDGLAEFRFYSKDEEGNISNRRLAERVPPQALRIEPGTGRIAFVAESTDGSKGTLLLTEDLEPGEAPKETTPIAENVHVGTARFLEQPRGLAYLSQTDESRYAELKVFLLDSELTLTVHSSVIEYRTIPWPAPGILYAVPEGEDQGLWFSKAR